MNNQAKIIFFGTPEFAVPTLKALHYEGYNIVLVVTQADKLVGRKQVLTPPVVKVEAKRLGLKVCQKLEDLKLEVKDLKPILGIVVAYGQIIPQEILDLFPLGCLNIHPSLLPKYRGPSPIQAAILNGDKETGVTIIKLDEKMDHGAKLSTSLGLENLRLKADDTYVSLSQRLAMASARLLIDILPDYLAGKIKPLPQDDSQATFTKILKREDGKIDWQKSAAEIERQIRAYQPWPGSYVKFSIFQPKAGLALAKGFQSSIKIISAKVADDLFLDDLTKIGQWQKKNRQLYVKCGQGALIIDKLQLAGKKEMTAQEFINGYLK